MASTLLLRPEHGFVLASIIGGYFVHHIYMASAVGKARKKYGVKYPTLYADESKTGEDGKRYNCVQRGHQNSLENLSSFYALTILAGARYPVSASIAAAVYLAGRVVYFNGYCSGDPNGRRRGGFLHLGTLAQLGLVARWAVELIRA